MARRRRDDIAGTVARPATDTLRAGPKVGTYEEDAAFSTVGTDLQVCPALAPAR